MTGAEDTLRIHSAGLELLAKVGVDVLGDGALSVFAAHGASVDGRRVFLPVTMVEQALADAPRTFTVRGRRPARDLEFGGAAPVLASASGATFTVAGETVRPSTFADFEAAVKLGYGSPVVHVHGNGPSALDLPVERRERIVLCTAHALSDKLVQSYVSTPDELSDALTVAGIVFGESWANEPRVIAVMNPTSPLQLSAEVCTSIETLARLGQVVCATPCVMGGTTGPLSLAGILAQQHAESLAEITLAQLVQAGQPGALRRYVGGVFHARRRTAARHCRTLAAHGGDCAPRARARFARARRRMSHRCPFGRLPGRCRIGCRYARGLA